MSIKPLHDRVVVRRVDAETTTKSGIIIPEKSAKKSSQGEVLAVGDGALASDGKLRPLAVKVGDRVLFGQYAGTDVKVDGETLLIMKEADILGVLEAANVQEKAA